MFEAESVKQCCARLYESDVARALLGSSFHPGGLELTERLGELLRLNARCRVLDVASGTGASAIFLAQRFGCEVVGIDFGTENVNRSNGLAATNGLASRVHFEQADAERLSLPDASFDALICECAFCTFPNKAAAASEFARLVRSGGRVGIADMTRVTALPKELDSLLAWAACVADAQTVETYSSYLNAAGFGIEHVESHDDALSELVNRVRATILGTELLVGLKQMNLPGVDLTVAKQMAAAALAAIQNGQIGYAIICGVKPR